MKWLNYHHLIYFKVIANQGSISKASEILNVGQPALSSQLKSLEEHLDVKLFERRNRQLFLTDAGKAVLEYANQINYLGQELLETVESKVFKKNIRLNIGALDNVPKMLISDLVDFAHKETGCFLSIIEGSKESLLNKLKSHEIEVIISDHDINNLKTNEIYSKRILKKQVSCFGSPDFYNLKKKFPESLEKVHAIVPTTHSKLRNDLEHYFHINEVSPRLIAETQDTSLQKILASKGDGVVFLPDFAAKELVSYERLVKLGTLKNLFAEYFLIYGKRMIENPAVDLLLSQDFEKMRPR